MDLHEQTVTAINYRYGWYTSQGIAPEPWERLTDSRKQYWVERATENAKVEAAHA